MSANRLTAFNLPIFVVSISTMVISGLMLALPGDFHHTSIYLQYPNWESYAWLIYFAISGALTFSGILLRNPYLEGGAAFMIAAAYLIDGLAIFLQRGVSGFLSGGLIVIAAFGLAMRGILILITENRKVDVLVSMAEELHDPEL